MRGACWLRFALAAALATFTFCAAAPAPASAGLIPGGACQAIGSLSNLGGKACDALSNPKGLLNAGKSLITGHIGTAVKDFVGGGGASAASTALGLAAIVAWVYTGARAALHLMATIVNETAAPQLGSVWFSSTYWRMAGVAALLTLPFLFAAAVQALLRSDLSLLTRAAFGHLPLALVAVGIAAPVTMLLLSGTDELCALVWSPSSTNGLSSLLAGGGVARVVGFVESPFLAFLLCAFTAGAAVLVWLELAMREAAVYIVVLMLPLAFAALVWPARRVWALRAVEMLVALILSKFAVVAVLGLGGAALNHATAHGLAAMLAGMVLVLLAAFAPWAVVRLVPIAEVASSAAGALRQHTDGAGKAVWERKEIEAADYALTGIASHIANLARHSTDGSRTKAPAPDVALPDGHSSNGRMKVEQAAGNWQDGGANGAAEGREEADNKSEEVGGVDLGRGADHGDLAGAAGGGDVPAEGRDAAGGADMAAYMGRTDFGATAGSVDADARDERVPGADPLWQAPDMSWRPMTLGREGWPPGPLWPPEDSDALTQEHSRDAAPSDVNRREETNRRAPRPDGAAAEQPDPLPPAQDPAGPL